MYDVVIIGGGPAGVAAGVYAARKKIKTMLITAEFGGQSLTSADIQNWIGTKNLSGLELAQNLEEHVRVYEAAGDIEIKSPDLVTSVEKIKGGFKVGTKAGTSYETKTVLVLSGSRHRKLNVPGEKELDGRGVVYCSTCDAPLFQKKTVAVIGGGNSGLEAVVDSLPYATKIYLLEYGSVLKGDATTQEKIKNNPKVEIILKAKTTKILGEKFVAGLQYEDMNTSAMKELKLDGVFVEIGAIPNAEFVNGLVEFNTFGEIIADPKTQQTSLSGIWAAGDVSDVLYKQNNISAGDAVKAILNIYDFLNK